MGYVYGEQICFLKSMLNSLEWLASVSGDRLVSVSTEVLFSLEQAIL